MALFGNYSEYSIAKANTEFGMFLMEGEVIESAFKLLRDAMVISNRRLILTDRQGLSGNKMRVVSINLHTIYSVTVETAGAGFDDSEITISYIVTPILGSRALEYAHHKMEFPKKFNVASLYCFFQELAYSNIKKFNNL